MRRIQRLLSRSADEHRLLLEAIGVVAFIRLGLTVLPFRSFRQFVLRRARWRAGVAVSVSADTAVWAVTVASRYIPAATCLTQAMASQLILARHGYPAELRIGVSKDAHGSFGAHAWLELHGRVVIGDVDLANYTPLPASF